MQLVKTGRDNLLRPLQIVSGIVERRHTLPILANILIRKEGEAVSFLSTDTEIQIVTHAEIGTMKKIRRQRSPHASFSTFFAHCRIRPISPFPKMTSDSLFRLANPVFPFRPCLPTIFRSSRNRLNMKRLSQSLKRH